MCSDVQACVTSGIVATSNTPPPPIMTREGVKMKREQGFLFYYKKTISTKTDYKAVHKHTVTAIFKCYKNLLILSDSK